MFLPMPESIRNIGTNIININNGEMTEGVENIIHGILKLVWGIFKSKWHNISLIMPKRSGKSSFVPIILTNLNLPEPRFHVKIGEHNSFTQPMDKVILIGNRISNSF